MKVFTDHKNLEYFTTMKVLNKRQVRWAEELAEYNFVIIWVVVDRLTKMVHLVPCNESITSEQLAHLYMSYIFARHGMPKMIISDRGSPFSSQFMRAFCEKLGAKTKLSTAYHPQTDGQTERTNQSVEQYLRIYCNYQQDDWVAWLPLAEFHLNNVRQASTGVSAYYANYGFHPELPSTLRAEDVRLTKKKDVPAAKEWADKVKEIQTELKTTLKAAQKRQAKAYDEKHKTAPPFEVGKKVWLLRCHIRMKRPSDKLDDKWLGPFKIKEVISRNARRLKLPETVRIHPVFHVSLLEPHNNQESERLAQMQL